MNTTKVGDEFEAEVFEFLKNELNTGRLGLIPECCRIFKKKGYYSNQRHSNIVFDLSIEIYRPGETNFSILILIECKNYSSSVPVNDVEEFLNKVNQVAGSGNGKAIIASTTSFQRGAFESAKSNGMSLLRYQDASNYKWVLNRSYGGRQGANRANQHSIEAGLIFDQVRDSVFNLNILSPNGLTRSIKDLFKDIIEKSDEAQYSHEFFKETSDSTFTVPFIQKEEIEERSLNVLLRNGYTGGIVRLPELCRMEKLNVQFGFEPTRLVAPSLILGQICFNPLYIEIYKQTELNPHRDRFTLAHELGHYYLNHSEYLLKEVFEVNDIENPVVHFGNDPEIARLEFQANHFASSLLMPKDNFIRDFINCLEHNDIKDRKHGLLFVDEQPCNRSNYYIVTSSLCDRYSVSRQAVKIRLETLGLLHSFAQNFEPQLLQSILNFERIAE